VWQAKLERVQKASDEINARVEAGLAKKEDAEAGLRDVRRVEAQEEEARVEEFKDNMNAQARQAAAVHDELQNDATRAGMDPDRDGEVRAAQEAGTRAYLSERKKQIDLAAASITKLQADLKAERVAALPVNGPDSILPRPWWQRQPSTVF
jgi:hypothetical protein